MIEIEELRDGMQFKGLILVEQVRDGERIYEYKSNNLMINGGIAQVTALMTGANTVDFAAMVVGTSTPVLGTTDTALAGSVQTVTTTNSQVTTTFSNDTAQFVGTFSFSASYTLYGACVQVAAGGTMLCEASIGTVTVVSGDSLAITWKVQA